MKSIAIPLASVVLIISPFIIDAAFLGHRGAIHPSANDSRNLSPRQDVGQVREKLCGFHWGDANDPWFAPEGFDCRFDVPNGIWGFCPTSVINARDCGLAGACVDSNNCKSGCGNTDGTDIQTHFCTVGAQNFCSTARLVVGPDQSYDYVACAVSPTLEFVYKQATTTGPTKAPVLLDIESESQRTASPQTTPSLDAPKATPAPGRTTEDSEEPTTTAPTRAPNTSSPTPTAGPQDETDEDTRTGVGNEGTTDATQSTSRRSSGSQTSGSQRSSTLQRTSGTLKTGSSEDATTASTNMPTIIGGVVGGVGGLALMGFGLWFYLRRKRNKKDIDKPLPLPPVYVRHEIDGTALPPEGRRHEMAHEGWWGYFGKVHVELDGELDGEGKRQGRWAHDELPGSHRWPARKRETVRYELP